MIDIEGSKYNVRDEGATRIFSPVAERVGMYAPARAIVVDVAIGKLIEAVRRGVSKNKQAFFEHENVRIALDKSDNRYSAAARYQEARSALNAPLPEIVPLPEKPKGITVRETTFDITDEGNERTFTVTSGPLGTSYCLDDLLSVNGRKLAFADAEDKKIFFQHERFRIPVYASDTVTDANDRYEAAVTAWRESPEVQQRFAEERLAQQQENLQKAALLATYANSSPIHLPDNTVIDSRASKEFNKQLRDQLCAGAKWLTDHPDKKPFEKGYDADREELKGFMNSIDTTGHSGFSAGHMLKMLEEITNKGPEAFANRRQSHTYRGFAERLEPSRPTGPIDFTKPRSAKTPAGRE